MLSVSICETSMGYIIARDACKGDLDCMMGAALFGVVVVGTVLLILYILGRKNK